MTTAIYTQNLLAMALNARNWSLFIRAIRTLSFFISYLLRPLLPIEHYGFT